MRKFLLAIVVILSFIGSAFNVGPIAFGQDKKPNEKMFKEIQEYKIKFLAQEMELSDKQTKEFAELYIKYDDERMKNFGEIRRLEKKLTPNSTEQEYKEINDKIASSRLRNAELDKEYNEKFSKILTSKQVYKLKEGEEKFRKKMQEMHRKRRSETKAKGGPKGGGKKR